MPSFTSHYSLSKKYPGKVLTHATKNKKTFLQIIQDKTIKIPSEHNSKRWTPYMEKHTRIDNCCYFSAGFDYNTMHHQFEYSFLFKPSLLKNKNFETFKTFLISQSWVLFQRYLLKHDKDSLLKLRNKNSKTKKQIDMLLEKTWNDWWHIEPELAKLFDNHKDKNKIIRKIKEFRKKMKLSNSYSPKYISTHYFDDDYSKKIEIVSHKSVSLDIPEFIGFYVEKNKLKTLLPLLKKEFPGKIVFDGKKVIKL